MKIERFFILFISILLWECADARSNETFANSGVCITDLYTKKDTLTLIDSSRNRVIPIATYNVVNSAPRNIKKKLVIFNPGYGSKSTDYGYIATNLSANGYFVIVIQHDLPTDDTLPRLGDIYKLRRAVWDRGVKSIFFVTDQLKKKYPQLDYDHIILMGHSNGGDMAMLIANEYPSFAKVVITLDNRRVAIPRADHPKIFSIRSSDQPADAGVLPAPEEQKRYKIKIVKVNTIHNDMGGRGTQAQKKETNLLIMDFLNSAR
ncbi:serine aminopeptidase domain-containing protein [Mucilaginibacter sp. McL0603]|uniref:serine aminopeptidase domain-containing protein n=1 Tax=Mucilaginibacter sp. McL0603 TaxID=3415670 RepID=UPI003CF10898